MKISLLLVAIGVVMLPGYVAVTCRPYCYMFVHCVPQPCRYYFRCYYRCYNMYKRTLGENGDGESIPIPSDFAGYDKNNDGFIDEPEFANFFGQSPDEYSMKNAFKIADKNDDDKLDKDEFENGPFEFEDQADKRGSDNMNKNKRTDNDAVSSNKKVDLLRKLSELLRSTK